MSNDPGPKKPLEKDAEFKRKAYIYTTILLVLGLIGGLLLADRIVTAEADRERPALEQEEAEDDDEQGPSDASEESLDR